MAAQEVVMPSGARAKVRDEGLVLLWTVLTLGIYNLVWYYRINREMRDFGRAHGDEKLADSNPVLSILAVTIGGLLIVPPMVSWWKCTGRIRRMQGLCNVEPVNGWIIGVSYVVGFFLFLTLAVIPPYVQDGLNKVWKLYPPAEGEGNEVELTSQAPAATPAATPPPTEPPAASA
jgi:hypothetical protein